VAHRSFAIVRRRLLAIVSALSLLLCLATLLLRLRSSSQEDVVQWDEWNLISSRGALVLWGGHSSEERYFGTLQLGSQRGVVDRLDLPNAGAYLGGFGIASFRSTPENDVFLTFPHWFLALLFAILPAIHLRAILRTRRRNRIGLCQNCGYDLRATPDRCPECGLRPQAARAPTHVGSGAQPDET
jgi:hypothetical protein